MNWREGLLEGSDEESWVMSSSGAKFTRSTRHYSPLFVRVASWRREPLSLATQRGPPPAKADAVPSSMVRGECPCSVFVVFPS